MTLNQRCKKLYAPLRKFCSKPAPNLVQLMPTYQKALELALDKKYELALNKFETLMDEITDEHSTNTPYHIYVLYKMATINNLSGNVYENENVYQRINEVAPMAYPDEPEMIYRCNDALLKYYLNFDVDKCWKYGEDIKKSNEYDFSKLPPYERHSLNHTLGTAYSLEGTMHDQSFDAYNECIRITDELKEKTQDPDLHINPGFALNNMGIGKFWCFIEKSRTIKNDDPKDKVERELKPYIHTLEEGIKDLKNAVIQFEQFDTRFSKGLEKGKMSQIELKQKLFVDEFFDTSIKETLGQNFEHYNLQDNEMNVKFVNELFTKGETCLPLANLGEISLIFNKMKEALAFLDISLKLIGEKDPTNLLRNKIITDLSGIVDLMDQTDMMIKMNSNLLKGLEQVNDYVKVFVLRNYGHLLMRHKQHEEEGKEYVHKADDLDRTFPYWAERKMCLFTPSPPHEPLENPL